MCNVPKVEVTRLAQELRSIDPPLVVDLRGPRELELGRIQGSVAISLERILDDPELLPKDRRIVLVCQTTGRSVAVADLLIEAGYVDVRALEGGMRAWTAVFGDRRSSA